MAAGLLLVLVSCGGRSHTVTYDWGYDGRTESVTAENGMPLLPCEPIRVGYEFDGWYAADPSETAVATAPWDFASDTVTGDLTLYAAWKPRADTVYLDAGGVECDPETTQFYYGEPVVFPEVEREGYYLDGWYYAGLKYVNGDLWWGDPAFGSEIRFTAKWTTFPPGMTVRFGTYEQDNDLENGKEPIEWIVLDYREGKYLLLADYILEGKPIHDAYGAGARSWQACSLRRWLNEVFYSEAFSDRERAHIALTELDDTQTRDHVFLLSYQELLAYTFEADYTVGRSTAYAKANGLEVNNGDEIDPEFSWWWLRTSRNAAIAYDRYSQTSVSGNGSVYGVRPVIWVDEEALG